MRVSGWSVRWLAIALVGLAGCGLWPIQPEGPRDPGRFPDQPERVGPEYRLGPMMSLGPVVTEAGFMVFYETADGWCTEQGHSAGCVGGAAQLPTGFSGINGMTLDDERLCLEVLTGNEVMRLRIFTGSEVVSLEPLRGSDVAPVNAFAVCWRPPIDPDALVVTAFDAVGNQVGDEFSANGN